MEVFFAQFVDAITWTNLLWSIVGITIGTAGGALPGVTALTTLSLLLPLSYYLGPTSGLILLGSVYCGTQYGSSISAVLTNVPGTPSSAVTSIHGYAMTVEGRPGAALLISAVSSFIGAMLAVVFLLSLTSPELILILLKFGPAEYFSVMLLGLVTVATLANDDLLRNLGSVFLGLAIGFVGMDTNTGIVRYTGGVPELVDGISVVIIATGMFGVAEVLVQLTNKNSYQVIEAVGAWKLTLAEWKNTVMASVRGAFVGGFFGALPGTGPAISSAMSYLLEEKIKKKDSDSHVEGIAGPESANNASAQSAFAPMLSLGIPGDAATALILSTLLVHGITPGPNLLTDRPDLFWSVIVSFLIANVAALVLNIPLAKIWVKMISIPYKYLFPTILALCAIGVYSVNFRWFDIVLLAIFGIIGFVLRKLNFEIMPLLLGLIMGSLLEETFRRMVIISDGNISAFLDRPVSLAMLSLTALILVAKIKFKKGKI